MPAGDKSQTQSPSAKDRQVRVFISSTFRDMHAERDHLATVVFPELRERIEQFGLEFFDVNLRWSVPAKNANGETANSSEYCWQWIELRGTIRRLHLRPTLRPSARTASARLATGPGSSTKNLEWQRLIILISARKRRATDDQGISILRAR